MYHVNTLFPYQYGLHFPREVKRKCSLNQGPFGVLRLTINKRKSYLKPSQETVFLGYYISTVDNGENEENPAGSTTLVIRDSSANPENCCLYWNDQCCKAGYHNCSTVSSPASGSPEAMKQRFHL